jgi:arylsulfatase A-like enzyme
MILRFLILCGFVCSPDLVGCLGAEISQPSPRPNIIVVMPDDVGYGDYGVLGAPIVKTPAVDRFRSQAVLFSRFHVSPTCSPTRAALFTGRHEFRSGVTHTIFERERMSLKAHPLPQVLRSAGYTTGLFGKWHLGDEEPYRPENRGFDEVCIHGGGGIGQTYSGSCGDVPGNTNLNPTLWHNGKFVKTSGYCTDVFFERALQWMDPHLDSGKPFFAFLALNAAHEPLVLPKEYYEHYLHQPGVSEDVARFYGMIENIDRNFGKLLAHLDARNAATNTLVVYLGGDNGGWAPACQRFNAGLRGSKATPYQGGTRTPCLIRWPSGGALGGQECKALTAHLDLFPTLAAAAGAEVPPAVEEALEGRNLIPLLQDPHAAWPERTLIHHVARWGKGQQPSRFQYVDCAIQNERYSLVNHTELYDLVGDPGETTNVAHQHPDLVLRLRSVYDAWWKDVQPDLIHENAIGPTVNPFKAMYWKQFGGGPSEADLQRMDPTSTVIPK